MIYSASPTKKFKKIFNAMKIYTEIIIVFRFKLIVIESDFNILLQQTISALWQIWIIINLLPLLFAFIRNDFNKYFVGKTQVIFRLD